MPKIITADPRRIDGGWALGREVRAAGVCQLPYGPNDPEPAYTCVDAWEPPHPMAVPGDLCDAILATVRAMEPTTVSANGTYYLRDLPADLKAPIVDRAKRANAMWWGLTIDDWPTAIKRYPAGSGHLRHQDLYAGSSRRKLAGTVQLSDPGDYEGGDLVILDGGINRYPMPRTRGTFVAFPGWTVHEVEPVTAGVRWSLLWNGWGPPLR